MAAGEARIHKITFIVTFIAFTKTSVMRSAVTSRLRYGVFLCVFFVWKDDADGVIYCVCRKAGDRPCMHQGDRDRDWKEEKAELSAVLKSASFARAPNLCSVLTYVCEMVFRDKVTPSRNTTSESKR